MNNVSRYLSIDNICLGLEVADGTEALHQAASMLERHSGISAASIFRALARREAVGSTGLGHGIAVPHARIAGIEQPVVLLLRTSSAIDFDSADRKSVSVLLVIVVPEHAREEHLQILAVASSMFADRGFRRRLKTAKDAVAARSLIDDWT